MKDMHKTSYFVIFTLLVAFLAGCASTRTQQSTGEYVDDAVITSKVKSKLIEDQALKGFQIDVDTFRGNVLLSGFVDNPNQIQQAVDIAKGVNGVKSVKNSLVVKESAKR
jgi:hyperosmotically inducible protein